MTPNFRAFPTRFAAAWAALAAACLCAAAPARADLSYQEGLAKDPQSQALLYREEHWTRRADEGIGERIVLYRCPDGTAFARKRIERQVTFFSEEKELGEVASAVAASPLMTRSMPPVPPPPAPPR